MQYAFQDSQNLYLVMDLLTGGDLRYHVSKYKKFTEEQARLEYLHTNNILHRDIKPENLVLDDQGYVRITDFGIAKMYQKDNASETSGTPGYMSPEVMVGQNHTMVVDYFALGVITYEFMMGTRPYLGKNRREIKEKMMAKQVQVKKQEIPEGWSFEAADFINRLLQRKPANRLGLRGAMEVKEHPWLRYYPWKDLYEKTLIAPFKPPEGDNFDHKYCNGGDKIGIDTREKYEGYLRDQVFKNAFNDFTFYGDLLDEKEEDQKYNNKSSNQQHPNNGANLISAKFFNPHINITNFIDENLQANVSNIINLNNSMNLNLSMNPNMSMLLPGGGSENYANKVLDKSISIENKFIKMKKQAISSSNASLLRQYKFSNPNSMNSTNTSISYLKKGASVTNLNN